MARDDNLANDELYDVAIVGFGPSGAVAAGPLGAQGIRTFVCDKAHDVFELPRAFAFDHGIMRVFQQLGIAKGLVARSFFATTCCSQAPTFAPCGSCWATVRSAQQ